MAELPARSLRGQIAVMQMSHYENWKEPFTVGAAAVLLLGGNHDRALPPAGQALYMPRYYVRGGGKLAYALRTGGVERASVHCDAEWRTVTARNVCALVPAAAGNERLPPLAITVPYDAMSIVIANFRIIDFSTFSFYSINIKSFFRSNRNFFIPNFAMLFSVSKNKTSLF